MKILFVRSGNNGIDPISTNQGESLMKLGIKLSFFDIVGKGIKGYLRNYPDLKSQIRIGGYDLIHAHYFLSGLLCTLTFPKIPIVVSLMGSDLYLNGIIRKLIQLFTKYFWSHTIVKSEKMAQMLQSSNISIIPNGVDLGLFKQINRTEALKLLDWSQYIYHILFASNVNRSEKNFSLAYKAIGLLEESLRKNIEIHVLDRIEHSQIYLFYNAANLLLLTSKHEGSPNVIKEAMACNCPIVSTDVGDVKEVIKDTAGCYITSFSPVDVSQKIQLAIEFSKNQVRTNGRVKMSNLDSKLVARRIINIYKRILNESM